MAEYQLGTEVKITESFTVDGILTNPTTVTFRVRQSDDVVLSFVYGVDAEVSRPSTGVFVLTFTPALAGDYFYEAQGTGAVIATSPTGTLTVIDSGVVPTAPPPLIPGPCSPWIDGQDVAECYTGSGVGSDFSAFDPFIETATDLLYSLSGRRYAGVCSQTVRPCRSACFGGFQVLSRGYVVTPFWGGWNGSGWLWDRALFCGCSPLSSVDLAGYPIRSITQVLIDGAIVDPTTYRLDKTTLVRLDGLAFPSCQDFGAPDTDPGTFSVTYRYGIDPPPSGKAAAVELAYQLWLKCNNSDECQLPDGVTRVTRQGVTFERPAFISFAYQSAQSRSLVSGWHTGLAAVDLFLNSHNRHGLQRRPTIMSPDGPRYAPNVGS